MSLFPSHHISAIQRGRGEDDVVWQRRQRRSLQFWKQWHRKVEKRKWAGMGHFAHVNDIHVNMPGASQKRDMVQLTRLYRPVFPSPPGMYVTRDCSGHFWDPCCAKKHVGELAFQAAAGPPPVVAALVWHGSYHRSRGAYNVPASNSL